MTEREALLLVVDDHDAGRFVKRRVLERAGYRILDASNGTDALALARQHRPDLLLLDVNLPDISGLEVARQLKAESNISPVQIVQISNTAVTDADRVAALDAGADAYLTEPVEPEVLLATVQAHLRIRRIELQLAEAAVREQLARRDAERANGLKDEFLAGLSHELRTPMNAILGWVWQLRHLPLSAEAKDRALASLERSAHLQNQLINDLLDVSRISKGKMRLTLRVVDIAPAVQLAAEGAAHLADAKQITIRANPPSAQVCGDVLRLQQVFTNLLTNAVQFTPAGGHVEIDGSVSDTAVTVHVRDNGAGIEPKFLPFVFEKFRQAERGLTRQHGGLGVGLSITHEVVALHGGTIAAASEGVGKGATFTVSLPVASPSLRALQTNPNAPLLAGIRVGVVAPDSPARAWLIGLLGGSGAVVATADHVDAGVRQGDVVIGAAADTGHSLVPYIHFPILAPDEKIEAMGPTEVLDAIARVIRPQPEVETSSRG